MMWPETLAKNLFFAACLTWSYYVGASYPDLWEPGNGSGCPHGLDWDPYWSLPWRREDGYVVDDED